MGVGFGFQAQQTWKRFREIPEWIEKLVRENGLTSPLAIKRVEELRKRDGGDRLMGMNALQRELERMRKEEVLQNKVDSVRLDTKISY
jgi:hypothetical protein